MNCRWHGRGFRLYPPDQSGPPRFLDHPIHCTLSRLSKLGVMFERSPNLRCPVMYLEVMRSLNRQGHEHQKAQQTKCELDASSVLMPARHERIHFLLTIEQLRRDAPDLKSRFSAMRFNHRRAVLRLMAEDQVMFGRQSPSGARRHSRYMSRRQPLPRRNAPRRPA